MRGLFLAASQAPDDIGRHCNRYFMDRH